MPLTPPARQLKHTRSITVQAFSRDDGLWDVEARLTDMKTRDVELAAVVRKVGEPIHDMTLRVTIDTSLRVVAASAISEAVPYPGSCENITPDYGQLVGLNLLNGFYREVRQRLSGVSGCTHLTELASVLPTAAVQAFAGDVFHTDGNADKQPFQLDRCHALRTDGAAVREFYPRWYRAPTAPT